MFSAFRLLGSRRRSSVRTKNRLEITETRNTLILDLDNTLICTVPIKDYWRNYWATGAEFLLLTRSNGMRRVVLKRPGLDEFLEKAAEMFHLAVYTASANEYCNAVVNWIDRDRGALKERYSRRSCIKVDGHLTKDITLVRRNLSKVAILDDNENAYRFFKPNAIKIKPWFGDFCDNELERVLEILKQLEHCDDVRAVLSTQHSNFSFF